MTSRQRKTKRERMEREVAWNIHHQWCHATKPLNRGEIVEAFLFLFLLLLECFFFSLSEIIRAHFSSPARIFLLTFCFFWCLLSCVGRLVCFFASFVPFLPLIWRFYCCFNPRFSFSFFIARRTNAGSNVRVFFSLLVFNCFGLVLVWQVNLLKASDFKATKQYTTLDFLIDNALRLMFMKPKIKKNVLHHIVLF